jgi:hypothetical protein
MAVVVPIEEWLECAICLDDDLKLEWRLLPCGHAFHKDCVERWLTESDTCPICRERVVETRLTIGGCLAGCFLCMCAGVGINLVISLILLAIK